MKRLTAIISLLLTICLVFSGCGVELSDTPSQTINTFVEQMKEAEGVTEQLKEKKQMEWTQKINNICSQAEEIVVCEIVLSAFITDKFY